MPGLTAFEAFAEVPEALRPLVVFVTAYDQYAVDAFEVVPSTTF
jgi:DNA-binding LytR/AlgR family response regulator